jgi:hypothetical protein
MKAEIYIEEAEILKKIEATVEKKLDEGGLMSFIRATIKREVRELMEGKLEQLKKHETEIAWLKRKQS